VFVAGLCFQLWWALAAFHNGHSVQQGSALKGQGFEYPTTLALGPSLLLPTGVAAAPVMGFRNSWWRLLLPPKDLRHALPVSHTGQHVGVVLTHHVSLHLHGQLGTSAWIGFVFALRMPLKGF
jgi:hypothetical protein